MKAFADLVERLQSSPSPAARIALLRRYFATTPDPDRGIGLAAITGDLRFPAVKPALIRALAAERADPVLFALSQDFVGDHTETIALIWPTQGSDAPPGLACIVHTLNTAAKPDLPVQIGAWLDAADASTRLALLKFITGSLRIAASAGLARRALAELSGGRIDAGAIEEIWHSLTPPYPTLFAWLEGRGPRPDPLDAPVFRPLMLANTLEPNDILPMEAPLYRAEWKWDGLRVQLVATAGGRRLYARGAEDISAGFPDIIAAMAFTGVLDGELLVIRDGEIAPFADLQHRLNRKTVSAKQQRDHPAAIRLYDLLFDGTEDHRPLDFDTRRARLEAWHARTAPARMDLSPLIAFRDIDDLEALRQGPPAAGVEGLMLKRAGAPYLPGRPRGNWWKWKRDPLTTDAVLMYAERGQASYTVGLWRADGDLVPIGKADSGLTDRERAFLDTWIGAHTTARFGPVREVTQGLVLEIAFDAVQLSPRHKSGIALRFPRIARLRTDKPAAEADRLETLMRLIK